MTLFSRRRAVFTHSGRDMKDRDLCFIDIETTGALFGFHEVIEVAAIRTSSDANRVLGTWHRRIRPEHPERFSAEARRINGYDGQLWVGAQASNEHLWLEFATFVQGCVPVCHNPAFDRAFLALAAIQCGIAELGLDYHWIGTESLAWPLYWTGDVQRLSLDCLCTFLGIDAETTPHTALAGARTCMNVYRGLMAKIAISPSRGRVTGLRADC